MAFSTEWEKIYRDKKHMSVWPWSHLVASCHRWECACSSSGAAPARIFLFSCHKEQIIMRPREARPSS